MLIRVAMGNMPKERQHPVPLEVAVLCSAVPAYRCCRQSLAAPHILCDACARAAEDRQRSRDEAAVQGIQLGALQSRQWHRFQSPQGRRQDDAVEEGHSLAGCDSSVRSLRFYLGPLEPCRLNPCRQGSGLMEMKLPSTRIVFAVAMYSNGILASGSDRWPVLR